MVESTSTQAARLASLLQGHHRCISSPAFEVEFRLPSLEDEFLEPLMRENIVLGCALQIVNAAWRLGRWAVTGTPMNSGLQDLYGLISFLGVDPYQSEQWWQSAIQKPYEQKSPAGQPLSFHGALPPGNLRPAAVLERTSAQSSRYCGTAVFPWTAWISKHSKSGAACLDP